MKHWAMFFGLGLIWGSSFLLIKTAVAPDGTIPAQVGLLDPLSLVTARIGLAAAGVYMHWTNYSHQLTELRTRTSAAAEKTKQLADLEARTKSQRQEFDKAAEVCELGRKAEPYNSDWLEQLARVYAQTNDKDKQIAVLKDLVPADADDIDHRKRLARLLLEQEQ